ncbi:MAG: polysaccharide deacetylase family protein [Clostridia bacterium]|nr:polysaccharide deacetylase family protein [Clostridia bacterium]
MFNGKMKALTFSYDDGVTQDIRLIEILNKYNLKSTFNINSELLGLSGELAYKDRTVPHNKVSKNDVRKIYKEHEIAVHSLTHPLLTVLDDEEVIRQVEQDRLNLSELAGYEVIGMAYPCGGNQNDDRTAKLIKENTGVRYARTITHSGNFDLQSNLYRFNPSGFHLDFDTMYSLADKFIEMKPDKPKIFYIWGHSYEFDMENTWNKFEEFCKYISGHSDIFYGTNKEILLNDFSDYI